MVATQALFVTEHLKEMITRYAKNPAQISPNGIATKPYLEKLVAKHIEITPDVRNGKACIRGTRIAVCDIVGDTWSLENNREQVFATYANMVPEDAVDAAYAFLMLNHDKVAEDFRECYGAPLPKELYG